MQAVNFTIYLWGVYNDCGGYMHTECKNCKKAKHRTCEEKKLIIKRLNIIEGQIRGIKDMVNDDRLCDDVLIQLSASIHSLKSLGNTILKSHMKTCMIKNLNEGNLEAIDEVIDLFQKLNK